MKPKPARQVKAWVSAIVVVVAGALSSALAADNPQPGVQVEVVPETIETRLLAPPVVEGGKPAWLSVYDHEGYPVAHFRVEVAGKELQSDSSGIVAFVCPENEFEVRLASGRTPGTGVEKAHEGVCYKRSAGGYLVLKNKIGPYVDSIEAAAPERQGPVLLYLPRSVDSMSPFVAIGRNFSGKFDGDRLKIDGLEAEIFAGSTVCLLARAGERIPVGPVREVCVVSQEESSGNCEIDLCRLAVNETAGSNDARVTIVGTNMPVMVEIENLTPAAGDIMFRSRRLGKAATLVSSGGESNRIDLSWQAKAPGRTQLNARMHCDPILSMVYGEPALEDANVGKVLQALFTDEARRLRRRLIAVDTRLADAVKQRDSKTGSPEDVSDLTTQVKALSLRKDRLTSALAVQRAICQSQGVSDSQFDAACDAASGGSGFSLDRTLAELDLAGTAALARADVRRRKRQASSSDAALLATGPVAVMPAAFMARIKSGRKSVSVSGGKLMPPPAPYKPDPSQLGLFLDPAYFPVTGAQPGAGVQKSKKSSGVSRRKRATPAKFGKTQSRKSATGKSVKKTGSRSAAGAGKQSSSRSAGG